MTNEIKHTPGPWEVDSENCDFRDVMTCARDENGNREMITSAYLMKVDSTWEGISRANARLIAAAPELLNALKALLPEMQREHDAGDGHFSTAQVDAVRSAIAKAESR